MTGTTNRMAVAYPRQHWDTWMQGPSRLSPERAFRAICLLALTLPLLLLVILFVDALADAAAGIVVLLALMLLLNGTAIWLRIRLQKRIYW